MGYPVRATKEQAGVGSKRADVDGEDRIEVNTGWPRGANPRRSGRAWSHTRRGRIVEGCQEPYEAVRPRFHSPKTNLNHRPERIPIFRLRATVWLNRERPNTSDPVGGGHPLPGRRGRRIPVPSAIGRLTFHRPKTDSLQRSSRRLSEKNRAT